MLIELRDGYRVGAAAIDAAGGRLDGVAIGEWMHGGDVREALGAPDPYASAGIELALDLLVERSRQPGTPAVSVHLGDRELEFGESADGAPAARLVSDVETFVRLCGGRRPDPSRFELRGTRPDDLVLFS